MYDFDEMKNSNQNEEPIIIDAQPMEKEEVTIDLSGGAGPVYTEHVKKKKAGKSGKRFVAAMVALSVLNLALFGSAYLLGRAHGSRPVSSRQELIATLNGESQETPGMTEALQREGELATTEIAKLVGPAVVGITGVVENYISIFGSSQSKSQGSGIILSADGYIVTNNHVVENTNSIHVTLNTGKEYEAKMIGADVQTDLAVIKIEPEETLTVAKLGDSSKLEVGERVVAIGNPMGVEFFGSVTQGIVSAVNRTVSIDNRSMNLIQTDAAINTGNSGGALINVYGEVIGINSVKVSSTGVEGMGFAIPISEANPIISDLLEHGYVKGRPVIGISTRDVNEYMAKSYSWPVGVQVMEVTSQAAVSAGLQQGDIITAVNGEKIKTGEELNRIKDKHKPGEVLKLDVYKYATGRNETAEVTLSEQLPG